MKEQRKIGTVEPIYGFHINPEETLAFINGAVKKYGDDISCHNSLIDYLNEMLDKTNPEEVDLGSGALEGEEVESNLKKCIITRYDTTINEPPYLTIELDTVEVCEPIKDDLGESFADILRDTCRRKGYNFRFYSMSDKEGYDYELVVWNDDYSM